MIGYLDTSALVPLLVAEEPSSDACRRFWDDADTIVSCRLSYAEAGAALAQALRLDQLNGSEYVRSMAALDDLWEQMDVVDVDDTLVRRGAALAHRFGLRGYDAVHCACAEQLADPSLVAATGDLALLDAWHRLGISTFDTKGAANDPSQ